jgi:hypothetical protein
MRKPRPHPAREPGTKEKATAYILERARIETWENLDRPAIVARFRGIVSQATLYRWIDSLRAESPDAEMQTIMRAPPRQAGAARKQLDVPTIKRLARNGKPVDAQRAAHDIKARAADHLPVLPSLDETATAIAGVPVPVMEKIGLCLQAAEDVMSKCRLDTGEIRNAKLLLVATEALRRSLDTAVKLQDAITDGLQVERFHAVVLDEVGKCDSETARRIVARLQEVANVWAEKK